MTTMLRATALLLACAAASAGCMDTDPGTDLSSTEDEVATKTTGPTAFRLTKVNVRDPHVFVGASGACADMTSQLDVAINLGLDMAGVRGLLFPTPVLVFRPLTPRARTSALEVHNARCAAPANRATCSAGLLAPWRSTVSNASSGTCLEPVRGTTSNYRPAIQSPSGSCFANNEGDLLLRIPGGWVTLHHARVGGTYLGANAHKIKDGLLRAFLTEADADAIVLPATLPVVGGKSVSALLGGGRGGCGPRADKDVVDGIPGWWLYINFDASQVPWRE
jgi:hypothetical protein